MLIFANHCHMSPLEDQIIFLLSLTTFHTKIWTYFLNTNNEIFLKSKTFKKLIENLFGKKIIH
jgi:hypothetical protein